MTRNFRNYFIDVMLLAMGFLCTVTGIIKWPGLAYFLGPGYPALPMDAITQVHDWTGLILGIFVLLHVAMHRRWLKEMTVKAIRDRRGEHETAGISH